MSEQQGKIDSMWAWGRKGNKESGPETFYMFWGY